MDERPLAILLGFLLLDAELVEAVEHHEVALLQSGLDLAHAVHLVQREQPQTQGERRHDADAEQDPQSDGQFHGRYPFARRGWDRMAAALSSPTRSAVSPRR